MLLSACNTACVHGTSKSLRSSTRQTHSGLSQMRSCFASSGALRTAVRARPGTGRSQRGVQVVASGLIDLPPRFGFVPLTVAASYLLVTWQYVQVAVARRECGVQYPQMYEEESEDGEISRFNWNPRIKDTLTTVQPPRRVVTTERRRIHLYPGPGLGYPLIATGAGWVWILGRVVYSQGYYTGDPSQRQKGSWNNFGMILLWTCTIMYGLKQLDFLP